MEDEDKLIRKNQLEINNEEEDNLTTKDKPDIEDKSKVVSYWFYTKQHQLMECNKFKNKPIEEKIKIVKEHELCWNNLSKRHLVKVCKSQHR